MEFRKYTKTAKGAAWEKHIEDKAPNLTYEEWREYAPMISLLQEMDSDTPMDLPTIIGEIQTVGGAWPAEEYGYAMDALLRKGYIEISV